MQWQVSLESLADTRRVAAGLAQWLTTPLTVSLCGPLGAGKTQFARDLAESLGVPGDIITSPTYVLVQRYFGRITLYHLDFYRLESIEQVWDLGIDEMLEGPAVTLIEWADKFPGCWPDECIRIDIEINTDQSRTMTFSSSGQRAQEIIRHLQS